MLVSNINHVNYLSKSRNSCGKRRSVQAGMSNLSNISDCKNDVSFNGNLFKAIGTLFKKTTASGGKYPLNKKDLVLRLKKENIKFNVSKANGSYVWVSTPENEYLFSGGGKILSQIHTNHVLSEADKGALEVRKISVYFYNDGVTPKFITRFNEHGRPTKRTDYRPDGTVREVTNYHKDDGIKNWVTFDFSGKKVEKIKYPPIIEGCDILAQ